MLRWISSLFGGSDGSGLKTRTVKVVNARYDAAQTTDNNRKHWANADGLSAQSANSAEVRRTLRNRARYEYQNNSYANGIVNTKADDIIGRGPRLQMLSTDAEFNAVLEDAWSKWAKKIHLTSKLRTLVISKIRDGESFGMMTTNRRIRFPIQLDLKLIEADQIGTPDLWADRPDKSIDGIEFDAFGDPAYYHVLGSHPGDTQWTPINYKRVPARFMIHLFRQTRAGEFRSVPEITPALPLFAMLRGYSLATLDAAKSAASYAGILYTDAPAGEEAELEPLDPVELDRNALLTMPQGWKMSQVKAEQPTGTYAEFKREILNEIARPLHMPFNVAACNSSSYNYASGRMDHQVYDRSIETEEAEIEEVALDPLFEEFMAEFVMIYPQYREADTVHKWFWDGGEHVDPSKEASAEQTRLESLTTTLADVYAKRGLDWETQLRQRAKEIELMAKLGIPLNIKSQAVTPDDEEEQESSLANA